MSDPVPVIDLFAGPGGLGEGFASLSSANRLSAFDVRLSIEKDPVAHQTLELRSFFRSFRGDGIPDAYYDFLRASNESVAKRRKKLYDDFPEQAHAAVGEAWLAELGETDPATVHQRISNGLKNAENWVLLGGPPCQAYSLAGRSRNRGNADYVAEEDNRQFLYVEYLQVLADHQPAVFVMENVKGLLSATVKNQCMFARILDDLAAPSLAIQREHRKSNPRVGTRSNSRYRLYSVVKQELFEGYRLNDFVVPMEQYGIPQSRHRIIVVGVREDLGTIAPARLEKESPSTVKQAIDGLPRLRSGLSREADSSDAWLTHLFNARSRRWFNAAQNKAGLSTFQLMNKSLDGINGSTCDRGGEFVKGPVSVDCYREWYLDNRIGGACNHSTRGHIVKDLWRYFYAACFAEANGHSPNLKDFPADLLPNHKNVADAMNGSQFSDRFRVQLFGKPATTITSHISKDGHYYIHPDPTQCRSLTVREAARLQTFPDNYFFCGPRTSQYIQVGNAVPPLLAHKIAKTVFNLLKKTGAAD